MGAITPTGRSSSPVEGLTRVTAPLREYRKLETPVRIYGLGPNGIFRAARLCNSYGSNNLEEARRRVETLPPAANLAGLAKQLRGAAIAPTDPVMIAPMVALLLDGFPSASRMGNPSVFVDFCVAALSDDCDEDEGAGGFSSMIVAAAVHRLIRNSRFCPSVAEVLEEARRVRDEVLLAARNISYLAELRSEADQLLEREYSRIASMQLDDTVSYEPLPETKTTV